MNRTSLRTLFAALLLASVPAGVLAQNSEGDAPSLVPVGDHCWWYSDFDRNYVVNINDLFTFLDNWYVRAEKGEASVQEMYDFLWLWNMTVGSSTEPSDGSSGCSD